MDIFIVWVILTILLLLTEILKRKGSYKGTKRVWLERVNRELWDISSICLALDLIDLLMLKNFFLWVAVFILSSLFVLYVRKLVDKL